MNSVAKTLIETNQLLPHPEGGYYKEIFRSVETIPEGVTPEHTGRRNFMTSILFLLNEEDKSHFHRLKSDEIWYFHAGTSAVIHFIHPNGNYVKNRIGLDSASGDRPQVIIPKNTWFAAEVINKEGFVFVGCAVAPGFDFSDFELATEDQLKELFPQHAQLIDRFTPV